MWRRVVRLRETSRLHLQGRRNHLLHAGFLLGLFFDPENGGDMFLRSASWPSTDYTAVYSIRQNSSDCYLFGVFPSKIDIWTWNTWRFFPCFVVRLLIRTEVL
jgi:hypothetical protein